MLYLYVYVAAKSVFSSKGVFKNDQKLILKIWLKIEFKWPENDLQLAKKWIKNWPIN
jgi:hypothetical protein